MSRGLTNGRRDLVTQEDERATAAPSSWWPTDYNERLIEEYERASAETPDDPKIHYEFGMSAITQRLTSEAVEAFTRYVGLCAGDPDGYYYLGLAHAAGGDDRKAALAFERSLAITPDDEDVLTTLHFSYFRLHRFTEAASCIERARAAPKKDVGQSATIIPGWPGFSEYLSADPDFYSCWIGINLLLAGDGGRAEPLLSQCTIAQGEIAEAAQFGLGLLAVTRGDEEAAELRRAALELSSSHLLPALASAITRGAVEPAEAVNALTGR